MPRRPAPLPPQLGRVFTRAEALAAGVPSHRLRCGDLERPFHTVYRRMTAGSAFGDSSAETHPNDLWRDTQIESARAFHCIMPDQHFFIGQTALALWGLPARPPPIGSPARDTITLGCFRPTRAVRHQGTKTTRLAPNRVNVLRLQGIPTCDPASLWALEAPRLSLDDQVALGDAIIRRPRIPGTNRLERPPHALLSDLESAAARCSKADRIVLEQALPLLSPHSASPPESHLRLRLQDWGLPTPDLDIDVYDDDGRLLGCTEVAYARYKIAFEYESVDHMTQRRRWNRDLKKYRDYEKNHWIVIRVTSLLLYRDHFELQETSHAALRRRGWTG